MHMSKVFSAFLGLIMPDITDLTEDGLSAGMVKAYAKQFFSKENCQDWKHLDCYWLYGSRSRVAWANGNWLTCWSYRKDKTLLSSSPMEQYTHSLLPLGERVLEKWIPIHHHSLINNS